LGRWKEEEALLLDLVLRRRNRNGLASEGGEGTVLDEVGKREEEGRREEGEREWGGWEVGREGRRSASFACLVVLILERNESWLFDFFSCEGRDVLRFLFSTRLPVFHYLPSFVVRSSFSHHSKLKLTILSFPLIPHRVSLSLSLVRIKQKGRRGS